MRESERLTYEPLSLSHVPFYYNWFNDPATTEHMVHGAHPMHEQECAEYVEKVRESPNDIVFAVLYQDIHIANVSLQRICWHHKSAEFGIIVGLACNRGKGFGAEITRHMLNYAFNELNLNRVYLGVLASNEAGVKAYEKAGFARCGTEHRAVFKYGKYVDVTRMEAFKEDL